MARSHNAPGAEPNSPTQPGLDRAPAEFSPSSRPWPVEPIVAAGLGIGFLLTLLMGYFSYQSINALTQTNQTVLHTEQVLTRLDVLTSAILDSESTARGYVLLGDADMLSRYQDSLPDIPLAISRLRELTADNGSQQERIDELQKIVDEKLSFHAQLVALRRDRGIQAATEAAAASQGRGRMLMDAIQAKVGELRAEELRLLEQRSNLAQERARMAISVILFGSLVAAVVVAGALARIWITTAALRRTEAKRKQSEEEMSHFFGMSLEMLAVADFDGYFRRLNPAWEKTLGWTREELMKKPFLEFIHPDDREATIRESEKVAKGEATIHFENRYACKDGSYRWLLWNASPMPERRLIFAVARDITERRQVEEVLRESEESHRLLFAGSPMPMWVFDQETLRFLSVNDEAIRHYGYSREEFLAMTIRDIRPPEEVSALLDDLASPRGHANTQIWKHRRKDGAVLLVQIHSQRMIYGGRPSSLIVAQDVTDRERASAERQRLHEEVERHAEELEVANRELEAFTYSVSHDLRAPLRHMDGFTRILIQEYGPKLEPLAQKYLDRISSASRQMGMLIDDLLNLSRVARRELSVQVAGLNALVKDVIVDLEHQTHDRGIEWRVAQLPFVECDPALLRQVFANLLSNAVKFTRPRGQAVIEVGQLEQNGHAAIFVRDNGVGFSMKYADKLFGVFQRLHRPEDFEGTGVGLATVQRIIHKHGGRIWAEAELDKGACFYFTLGPPRDPSRAGDTDSGGNS